MRATMKYFFIHINDPIWELRYTVYSAGPQLTLSRYGRLITARVLSLANEGMLISLGLRRALVHAGVKAHLSRSRSFSLISSNH